MIGTLNADYYTLSFKPEGDVLGWQSFYSFDPEDMIGMNSHLYSFKNGNLYKHNANSVRNNYYGEQFNSKLIGVMNQDPSSVKTFKTFNIEGNAAWDVILESNLISGEVQSQWFQLREGEYHTFIRRVDSDDNYNLRSAQGIGSVLSVVPNISDSVINFDFVLDSMISVGDKLFRTSGGGLVLVGTITAKDTQSITVDTPTSGLSPGNFVVYIKDNTAESYGVSGYYMRYEMENSAATRVELFSIGSSVMKSYP